MHLISAGASISRLADLEDSVRGSKLVIGDGCMIDSFVKIKFTGGLGDVIVGERTYINSGTVLYSGNGIRLGNDVLIAANCTFAAANHAFAARDLPIARQRFQPSRGGIIVEDDVWIAANCVILDGALIRKGAVIGAHSLVPDEVEAYSVNVGSPVRRIGSR